MDITSLTQVFDFAVKALSYLAPVFSNLNLLIPFIVALGIGYDLIRPFLPEKFQKNEKITIVKTITVIISIFSAVAVFSALLFLYVALNYVIAFQIEPSLLDTIITFGISFITLLIYVKYREDLKFGVVTYFSKILAVFFLLMGIGVILISLKESGNILFRFIKGLGFFLGILFISAILYSRKIKPFINGPLLMTQIDEKIEKFIEKHQDRLLWLVLIGTLLVIASAILYAFFG